MSDRVIGYWVAMTMLGIGAGWSLGAMVAVAAPVLAWGAALFAVAFIVSATVVVLLQDAGQARSAGAGDIAVICPLCGDLEFDPPECVKRGHQAKARGGS